MRGSTIAAKPAGRSSSDDDIAHWRCLHAALQATQRLMREIDATIDRRGGWSTGPGTGGAFGLDHPPPSVEALADQAAARPRGRRRAAVPGRHSLLEADEEPEPARPRARAKPVGDGPDDGAAN